MIDNNLPPALAAALDSLSKGEGHNVVHLAEKFARDTTDLEWISVLKNEGSWIVISQDSFRKSDLERQAVRESGLIVFCLAKQWAKAPYWEKAHQLVRWWPAIINQSQRLSGGAALRVPWRFSPPGKFEQIKV